MKLKKIFKQIISKQNKEKKTHKQLTMELTLMERANLPYQWFASPESVKSVDLCIRWRIFIKISFVSGGWQVVYYPLYTPLHLDISERTLFPKGISVNNYNFILYTISRQALLYVHTLSRKGYCMSKESFPIFHSILTIYKWTRLPGHTVFALQLNSYSVIATRTF